MKDRPKASVIWPILAYALLLPSFSMAQLKSDYYMDRSSDCGIGIYDVQRDQTINIYARSEQSTSTQGACTMNFKAVDHDASLVLEFIVFTVQACEKVFLYLSGDASGRTKVYGCGDRDPNDYVTIGDSITVTLHKTDIANQDYTFQLRLTAYRESKFPPPGDSNPMAVGMVIGIVGGVFGVIIIVSIIGICCFRKYRARGPTKSPYLYDPNSKTKLDENQSHQSVGYTNENMNGSPMSKRKLLAPSDSSDEKSEHGSGRGPRMSNYRNNDRNNVRVNNVPPPPTVAVSPMKPSNNGYNEINDIDDKHKQSGGAYEERGVDVNPRPRNPMLGALKSNSKFKNTFESTEIEAEDRAKRISSTSSFENFGIAPTPPDSNENLSRPNLPPVPKSPTSKSKQKTAKIGRNPRPNSFSSDELKKLEKGVGDREDDRNRIMHDSSTASSTEVVPVKVNEKSKKADTTHGLRPDRKGKKGGRNQSVSSTLDTDPKPSPRAPREKERVQAFEREFNDTSSQNGSGRYSKKTGRKSPRHGRSSGGKGFSHRRGRSADPYDSRPTTPISNYGSLEDLESLPPLQRAGSKNSLYASRSSLYDRRGRRRKGSNGSVYSYGTARDDISVGRRSQNYDSFSDEDDFDGYEKPLSRRDRERMYRSDNDLGRRGKREISTQTLRETATQTGPNETVEMQPKMLVKKKKRSQSLTSAGTQTTSKKTEEGKGKKKVEKESNVDTDNEIKKKRKSRRTKSSGSSEGTLKGKRSKSLDALDVDDQKPKLKPKPAPRKSTSALKENISGSKENLNNPNENNNPYYPQSEGFAPNYYPQGYPMVPPSGYPGQPPQGQYPYPVNTGMPNYPPNNLPQQRPPVMNGNVQPIPRGPKKSNWEILCEMTDGQRKDDPVEIGSVASSVFTNNPGNYPVYPAQSMGQPYYNNQGYYPPPPQPQYYQEAGPGHYPQYPQSNMRAQSVPDFMHDLSMSTSSDDTQERQEKRQATIEKLKEDAKPHVSDNKKSSQPKLQVPAKNHRTESVV